MERFRYPDVAVILERGIAPSNRYIDTMIAPRVEAERAERQRTRAPQKGGDRQQRTRFIEDEAAVGGSSDGEDGFSGSDVDEAEDAADARDGPVSTTREDSAEGSDGECASGGEDSDAGSVISVRTDVSSDSFVVSDSAELEYEPLVARAQGGDLEDEEMPRRRANMTVPGRPGARVGPSLQTRDAVIALLDYMDGIRDRDMAPLDPEAGDGELGGRNRNASGVPTKIGAINRRKPPPPRAAPLKLLPRQEAFAVRCTAVDDNQAAKFTNHFTGPVALTLAQVADTLPYWVSNGADETSNDLCISLTNIPLRILSDITAESYSLFLNEKDRPLQVGLIHPDVSHTPLVSFYLTLADCYTSVNNGQGLAWLVQNPTMHPIQFAITSDALEQQFRICVAYVTEQRPENHTHLLGHDDTYRLYYQFLLLFLTKPEEGTVTEEIVVKRVRKILSGAVLHYVAPEAVLPSPMVLSSFHMVVARISLFTGRNGSALFNEFVSDVSNRTTLATFAALTGISNAMGSGNARYHNALHINTQQMNLTKAGIDLGVCLKKFSFKKGLSM
jgi:hypothetical protein